MRGDGGGCTKGNNARVDYGNKLMTHVPWSVMFYGGVLLFIFGLNTKSSTFVEDGVQKLL